MSEAEEQLGRKIGEQLFAKPESEAPDPQPKPEAESSLGARADSESSSASKPEPKSPEEAHNELLAQLLAPPRQVEEP